MKMNSIQSFTIAIVVALVLFVFVRYIYNMYSKECSQCAAERVRMNQKIEKATKKESPLSSKESPKESPKELPSKELPSKESPSNESLECEIGDED